MKIVLSVLFLFFINSSFSQVIIDKYANDLCAIKKVTISAQVKKKPLRIIFWKTNYKKVKRIDRVIDQNGNLVKKIVMKSKQNGDEYLFRKFRRLVVIDDEIHECFANVISKKGIIKVYDFCGNLLERKLISSEEVFEKYGFNAIYVPID